MVSDLLVEDRDSWWVDRMYLQDAFAAARLSPDPRTQVGAALVLPNGMGVVLKSHNSVLECLSSAQYAQDLKLKNHCTEHAERRVIFKALRNSLPTDGLTMYSTWAACSECSRAIIQFGIKRVVTLTRLVERTSPDWEESIRMGLLMMRDSGVQVVGWSGDLGTKYTIRFRGETVGNEDLK